MNAEEGGAPPYRAPSQESKGAPCGGGEGGPHWSKRSAAGRPADDLGESRAGESARPGLKLRPKPPLALRLGFPAIKGGRGPPEGPQDGARLCTYLGAAGAEAQGGRGGH